jgi:hypothetical protein
MLILIAGPYRCGTKDNPWMLRENLSKLEAAALPLFRLGHIPLIGEWVSLPLIRLSGSPKPGEPEYEKILYPVAHQLLAKCDAVLRLDGVSQSADEEVRLAKERGLQVYYCVEEVPYA